MAGGGGTAAAVVPRVRPSELTIHQLHNKLAELHQLHNKLTEQQQQEKLLQKIYRGGPAVDNERGEPRGGGRGDRGRA